MRQRRQPTRQSQQELSIRANKEPRLRASSVSLPGCKASRCQIATPDKPTPQTESAATLRATLKPRPSARRRPNHRTPPTPPPHPSRLLFKEGLHRLSRVGLGQRYSRRTPVLRGVLGDQNLHLLREGLARARNGFGDPGEQRALLFGGTARSHRIWTRGMVISPLKMRPVPGSGFRSRPSPPSRGVRPPSPRPP